MQQQEYTRIAKSEGLRKSRAEPAVLRCTKIQISYFEEFSGYLLALPSKVSHCPFAPRSRWLWSTVALCAVRSAMAR